MAAGAASKEKVEEEPDEFEEHIAAAGFGRFNIICVLIGFPISMAIIFATSISSYAITAMRCDLFLTTKEKGALNSMVYWGMMFGGIFWAIISDFKGRRPVIILTHALDAIFANMSAMSQTVLTLFFFKFLCGLSISGGYIAFMAYISEVHAQKRRAQILFIMGMLLTLSAALLPLLAMIMLPRHWRLDLFKYHYTSWQFFLTIGTLPSITVTIVFLFMPESPKFDMVNGNDVRAHKSFRRIHSINVGKQNEYPYKAPDKPTSQTRKQFNLNSIKALLSRKFFFTAVLIFIIEFCVLMCQNTMRLWQPSILLIVDDLDDDLDFCNIIEKIDVEIETTNATHDYCDTQVTAKMYGGNVVMGLVSVAAFFVAIALVNTIGSKIILIGSLCFSMIFSVGLYVVSGKILLLVDFAMYLSVEYVVGTALVHSAVQSFPTLVRATVLSLVMLCGRLGSTIGNLIFPYIMEMGCIAPIIWLMSCSIISSICAIILPSPEKCKMK